MDLSFLGIIGVVAFASVLITYLIMSSSKTVTKYVVLDDDLDSIPADSREAKMMINLSFLERQGKGDSPRANALKKKLGFK